MTQWIIDVIAAGGYLGVAFLMAIENVFPPIPSEVIMGLSGIAVAQGRMAFAPLMVAGTLGSTAGNYLWFLAGRRMGYAGLKPFVARWGRWLTLEWDDVEKLVAFFQKHGHHVVFWLRFSPFLRTMISLPAGMARMGHIRFLLFTFCGAAIWNALLVGAGYYLGRNFGELADYTGPVAVATLVIAALAYGWRVLTWQPRARGDDGDG